ncbi:MAG: hypothetical protein Ta2G_02860 [Termitinemataceae bacterium]|nr:MAG: hypothetical protein Ta2G_02860 [Termitinemataceae bacterium]
MNTKNKMILVLIMFISIAALTMTACGKPPLDEMNNAVAALSRAENNPDVPIYAAGSLSRARAAVESMQSESDGRRYDAAKQLAEEAIILSEKAISDAQTAIARSKEDAQNAIESLDAAINEADQTIKDARRSGQKGIDFSEIGKEFEAAKLNAEEAKLANADRKYREAIDKSQNARGQLTSITSKLSQTVIATNRKK